MQLWHQSSPPHISLRLRFKSVRLRQQLIQESHTPSPCIITRGPGYHLLDIKETRMALLLALPPTQQPEDASSFPGSCHQTAHRLDTLRLCLSRHKQAISGTEPQKWRVRWQGTARRNRSLWTTSRPCAAVAARWSSTSAAWQSRCMLQLRFTGVDLRSSTFDYFSAWPYDNFRR